MIMQRPQNDNLGVEGLELMEWRWKNQGKLWDGKQSLNDKRIIIKVLEIL